MTSGPLADQEQDPTGPLQLAVVAAAKLVAGGTDVTTCQLEEWGW